MKLLPHTQKAAEYDRADLAAHQSHSVHAAGKRRGVRDTGYRAHFENKQKQVHHQRDKRHTNAHGQQ